MFPPPSPSNIYTCSVSRRKASMKISRANEGALVTDRSSHPIIFFQTKKRVYLIDKKGSFVSVSLSTLQSVELTLYHNCVKIGGKRISVKKVLSLAFFGNTGSFDRIIFRNGNRRDMKRTNLIFVGLEGDSLMALLGGNPCRTCVRIHDED